MNRREFIQTSSLGAACLAVGIKIKTPYKVNDRNCEVRELLFNEVLSKPWNCRGRGYPEQKLVTVECNSRPHVCSLLGYDKKGGFVSLWSANLDDLCVPPKSVIEKHVSHKICMLKKAISPKSNLYAFYC